MHAWQIILLTDSQTQQKNLKDTIISKAQALSTCINSFISPFTFRNVKHDPIADGLYQEVSSKTKGVFVPPPRRPDINLSREIPDLKTSVLVIKYPSLYPRDLEKLQKGQSVQFIVLPFTAAVAGAG